MKRSPDPFLEEKTAVDDKKEEDSQGHACNERVIEPQPQLSSYLSILIVVSFPRDGSDISFNKSASLLHN